MLRVICQAIFLLSILIVSGCANGTGGFGWVTDSERYYQMSGFSVQPPSGADWYRLSKDGKNSNVISFRKFQNATPRYSVHPDFTVTSVMAYGFSLKKPVPRVDSARKDALSGMLKERQKKAGLEIASWSYESSLGAECLAYQGAPKDADYTIDIGAVRSPVRTHSVTGYICLHPLQDDFAVVMESSNGATVEIAPVNREQQVDHFFKSIRFTPRTLQAGTPSKAEGTRSFQ